MGKLVPNEIKLLHLLQRRYGTLKIKRISLLLHRQDDFKEQVRFYILEMEAVANSLHSEHQFWDRVPQSSSPAVHKEASSGNPREQLIMNAVFLSVPSRLKTHLPNTKWHFYQGVGPLFINHRCSGT